MNYLSDDRRNALSSEYVLGTLQGPARIRFQRLLMQHPSMRKTLRHWEGHLNALGGSLPSQAVPAHVWENIQIRLGFIESAAMASVTPANIVQFADRPSRKWQWLSSLSAAAAVIFAVLLFVPKSFEQGEIPRIAIVQSEKAQALWLIELLYYLPTSAVRA